MDRRSFIGLGAVALAFTTNLADPWTAEAQVARSADYPFTLGVASGDPLPDAVMLWTRLATKPLEPLGGMPYNRIRVDWEVAEDDRFSRRVRHGSAWAVPEFGHSVHVDVRGLRPGRDYYYRFRTGGQISPVARTRTAPVGSPEQLKLAFASCASWQDGYYSAYRHLAEEGADVVFHLGDYIYEYGIVPTGGNRRTPVPEQFRVQCDTLDRFRIQYGLYKSDPDLQAAHHAAPWIVTWDDHEVLDNWAGPNGPGGDVTEQDFLVMRANAFRAYWENQPIRVPAVQGPDARIFRRFAFGDLAEFSVLDTRQYRADQVCGDGQQTDCADRLDPSRQLLGSEQEKWLSDGLSRSRARWNVLAQQIVVCRLDFDPGPAQKLSMDLWDGYKPAKDRVIDQLSRVRNPVVLSGDLHYNLAGEIKANFDDPASKTVGVEFVGTSVTSGGNGNARTGIPAGGNDPLNPHIRFSSYQRGYVSCAVTRDRWQADYKVVPYVDQPDAPVSTRGSLVALDGVPGLQAL